MKYKYELEQLNAVGVDNIRTLVEEAHRKYNSDKTPKDDDAQKAYMLYRYIVDNNIKSLRHVLDYVFQNNLWSAWRRGQSTFKDLIRENTLSNKDFDKLQDNYNTALAGLAKLGDNNAVLRNVIDYQNEILYTLGVKTISLDDVKKEMIQDEIAKHR